MDEQNYYIKLAHCCAHAR